MLFIQAYEPLIDGQTLSRTYHITNRNRDNSYEYNNKRALNR